MPPKPTYAEIEEKVRALEQEKALSQGKEKIDLALQAASMGVWEWHAETGRLILSEAHARLFGMTLEDFSGTIEDIKACVHPEDIPLCRKFLEKVVAAGTKQDGVTYRVRHRDGSWRWHISNGAPMRDPAGNLTGYVGIARDITENKQAEEALREREEKYRLLFEKVNDAMAFKGKAILQSMVRDVSDRKQNEAKRAEFESLLNSTLDAVDSLLMVIDKNLRIVLCNWKDHEWVPAEERGKMPYCYKAIKGLEIPCENCPALETFKDGKPKCHEDRNPLDGSYKQVSIVPIFDEKGKVEYVLENVRDVTAFKQALTSLIINAWEATGDSDGNVILRTRIVNVSDIEGNRFYPPDWEPKEDVYASIEVSDQGCGIREEHFDKIFDPFFSTKLTGRGLGLSTVLGTIKAGNGSLEVVSRTGRGTTFRIFLPVEKNQQQHLHGASTKKKHAGKPDTVLLVEDHEEVRRMTRDQLRHLGYTVIDVSGGHEAIEVIRENISAVDCVITDLSMPGMDGWETIAAIKQMAPGIPVILASGYNEAQVIDNRYSHQPDAFLQKPYQMSELKASLNNLKK